MYLYYNVARLFINFFIGIYQANFGYYTYLVFYNVVMRSQLEDGLGQQGYLTTSGASKGFSTYCRLLGGGFILVFRDFFGDLFVLVYVLGL